MAFLRGLQTLKGTFSAGRELRLPDPGPWILSMEKAVEGCRTPRRFAIGEEVFTFLSGPLSPQERCVVAQSLCFCSGSAWGFGVEFSFPPNFKDMVFIAAAGAR